MLSSSIQSDLSVFAHELASIKASICLRAEDAMKKAALAGCLFCCDAFFHERASTSFFHERASTARVHLAPT